MCKRKKMSLWNFDQTFGLKIPAETSLTRRWMSACLKVIVGEVPLSKFCVSGQRFCSAAISSKSIDTVAAVAMSGVVTMFDVAVISLFSAPCARVKPIGTWNGEWRQRIPNISIPLWQSQVCLGQAGGPWQRQVVSARLKVVLLPMSRVGTKSPGRRIDGNFEAKLECPQARRLQTALIVNGLKMTAVRWLLNVNNLKCL